MVINADPLVHAFWREYDGLFSKRWLCKRDHCGVTAAEFIHWLSYKGILNAERVFGTFHLDVAVHDYYDFTEVERQKMIEEGLDPKIDQDRLQFVRQNKDVEESCKRMPHYWVIVNDRIYDPVAQYQFLNTGLAKDLLPWRYVDTPALTPSATTPKSTSLVPRL